MNRALLGDVHFDATFEESPEYPNEITDKPVEQGANVADHVRPLSITLSISGVVAGPDAAQRLERLRRYREEGAQLSYVGRNILHNVVIESLRTNHNVQIRDGFSFDIALRQIRLAVRQEASFRVPPAIAPQANPTANAGTQQPGEQETQSRSSMARQIWDAASDYLSNVFQ